MLARDDDAFKCLYALFIAFFDLNVNANRVAGLESRDGVAELAIFDRLHYWVHDNYLSLLDIRVRPATRVSEPKAATSRLIHLSQNLFDQAALVFAERAPFEQIGPALQRLFHRLAPPPFFNLAVVAAH